MYLPQYVNTQCYVQSPPVALDVVFSLVTVCLLHCESLEPLARLPLWNH